ncbi:MAG: hypothetical protein ACKO8O_15000 [Betaproteobacteria bacterium]
MNIARYARGVLGDSKLDVKICSADGCIQFALGRAAGEEQAAEQAGPPMINAKPGAPLEIWVHQSALGERLPAVAEALAAVHQPLNVVKTTLPLLQALALSQSDASEPVAIRVHEDWVVIGWDPNAAKSDSAASSARIVTHNARR